MVYAELEQVRVFQLWYMCFMLALLDLVCLYQCTVLYEYALALVLSLSRIVLCNIIVRISPVEFN